MTRTPCDEGVIHGAPAAADVVVDGATRRWVLVATILGSSMAFIDGTVVNVALPRLQDDFCVSATAAQWVVESYALFLAALILVGGSLGDLLGRRRIFATGIAIFAVASLGCALAQDVGQLIAARAVQGVGGALLVPGSLAIISATFPDEERGKAIGTWSGATAITSAFGPVLGGWLVDEASWRWVFLINLPLALAVLAIVRARVPESRDPDAERIDWLGAALITAGLGLLVVGLIEAPVRGWTDPLVLVPIVAGLLAIAAFVVVEARVHAPMLPLGLFRSRTFAGTNLLTLLLYGGLGGALFWVPFALQQVHDYSATAAGAALMPMVLILAALSRWAGGLINRFGAKPPLVVGPAIATIGFLLFARPGIDGSYWTTFFPAVLVLGIGMAITVAPLTTTVMNAVEARHAGLASGVNNAVARVAGLLAIALFGIAVASTFRDELAERLDGIDLAPEQRAAVEEERDRLAAAELPAGLDESTAGAVEDAIDRSFVAGFRVAMVLAAVLAALGALAALEMIEPTPRDPPLSDAPG